MFNYWQSAERAGGWRRTSEPSKQCGYNTLRYITISIEHRPTDSARDTKEKSTIRGLKTRLTSTEFVVNICIVYDALTELAQVQCYFSYAFQFQL